MAQVSMHPSWGLGCTGTAACRSVHCFDKIELRGEGTYGYEYGDHIPFPFPLA